MGIRYSSLHSAVAPWTWGTPAFSGAHIALEERDRLEPAAYDYNRSEAIYATRPWEVYGKGPFQRKFPGKISGKKPDRTKHGYATEDVRFTRSEDCRTVFDIFMAPPRAVCPSNPCAL